MNRAIGANLLLLLLSAVAQSAPPLPAHVETGWPHLRGPSYDGTSRETNLADSWHESGPPVLWIKELGQGYSSIVVKNERAFTQYQSLTGQFVLCLEAGTGKTLWTYRYDWPFEAAGLYPGPYSTPTVSNDHVYFTSPSGSVTCLSVTGQFVWSRELKQEFDGKGTDFGYACSPTVVDGKVILPVGGRGASLVALNSMSGELLWKSGDEPASYVPALPITLNNEAQVIAYLEHALVGCDLKTGRQLWKQTLSRGYDEHSAWPIYREPFLWTSAPFQAGSWLWELSAGDQPACREVRHSELMSNDVSSSVLVDDTIYGFDLAEAQSKAHRASRGSFRAIDWRTGEERWHNGDSTVRRTTDLAATSSPQVVGHASVLAGDGKLFLLNDTGDLILLEANPTRYVELARTRVLGGEIGWASPALDQGRIFVRNGSRAVCLFVGEPSLASKEVRASQLTVADLHQGNVYDFSALIGIEPEYAMDPPTKRWLLQWYLAGVSILTAAGLIVVSLKLVIAKRMTASSCRRAFCGITFAMGIVLGPIASLVCNDFVFTWPICLFIAFAVALHRCQLRRQATTIAVKPRATADRAVAILFLVVCGVYFVACRRLSLVTQWLFLCGFPVAIPPLLLDRYLLSRSTDAQFGTWKSLVASWLITQIAFAAYFIATAWLFAVKYELSAS